ncbi:hypothetical protein HAX54_015085 [Datura stramonium]|uniref:Uncharacterized protein n=1 Tax=Datura stramonium TaxID=4076 RepID=A0ABS8TSC4_DATST|nr:hypothetical protein [Datura stramonium]
MVAKTMPVLEQGNGFLITVVSLQFLRGGKHGSILGVFEWFGTNPMPPEFWILPSFLPMHPAKNVVLLSN